MLSNFAPASPSHFNLIFEVNMRYVLSLGCFLIATNVAALAQLRSENLSPDLAAIKAAEDAATKVLLSCVDRATKHLDDHRPDPATIAQGALSACGTEFDATVETFSRNYDNYLAVREKVTTQLRQSSMDFAIQRVLINRKVDRH